MAQEPAEIRVFQRIGALGESWGHAWTSETLFGGSVRVKPGLILGGTVPVVALFGRDGSAVGLGNVVVWADLGRAWADFRLAGGLQVEAPTSTHEELADRHVVVLPYIRGRYQAGRWDVGGRMGLSQVLGSVKSGYDNPNGLGHDHADQPINPHADTEALVRLEAGVLARLGEPTARVALRTDLTHELVDDRRTFVSAGPVLEITKGRVLAQGFAEIPLTTLRRNELRLGTQVGFAWGRAADRRGIPALALSQLQLEES